MTLDLRDKISLEKACETYENSITKVWRIEEARKYDKIIFFSFKDNFVWFFAKGLSAEYDLVNINNALLIVKI